MRVAVQLARTAGDDHACESLCGDRNRKEQQDEDEEEMARHGQVDDSKTEAAKNL